MDWNKVYDILVEECGADEYWRENFVYSMNNDCKEYRFQGDLGFGGKMRNNCNGMYVDCYPNDETPARKAQIAAANKRIKELVDGRT
jgi:hypothetical protein